MITTADILAKAIFGKVYVDLTKTGKFDIDRTLKELDKAGYSIVKDSEQPKLECVCCGSDTLTEVEPTKTPDTSIFCSDCKWLGSSNETGNDDGESYCPQCGSYRVSKKS